MVVVAIVAVTAVVTVEASAVAAASAAEASVVLEDVVSDTCFYSYIEKTSQTPLTEICDVFYFYKLSMICSITLGKCSISSRCSLWAMSSGVSSGERGVRNCAMISPPSQTSET